MSKEQSVCSICKWEKNYVCENNKSIYYLDYPIHDNGCNCFEKSEEAIKLDKQISFKDEVYIITNGIAELLVSKNKKYGNSALEPKRIFSKATSVEQILVRIDDKLSRIANQNIDEDEDVLEDLIGYLVLLKISLQNKTKEKINE